MAVVPKIVFTDEGVGVENQTLFTNAYKTFLTSDTASAVTTLSIKNATGFTTGAQVLVLGELGNEGTELIQSTNTTASTLTVGLKSSTVYPHSSGTPVYILNYDQVETSNAATVAGSKSVLNTQNIQPYNANTMYVDTAGSIGYYFTRFYNTLTTTFSGYSSSAPTTGYTPLTARSIIDNALGMINKDLSEVLTDKYAFQQINNCQYEVLRELKRWSFMQVFDYNMGQITTGQWKIAVPTDLDDQNTNKSIYNFKIGTLDSMSWVDKEKWNEITQGVAHTTLSTAIVSGTTTTCLLANSSDFPDAGTLQITSNTYSYSSIDRTTNIVTLSSTATTSDSVSADVFSGASLGTPLYWTTFGGNLYFYPVMGTSYSQRDGHLDYYKSLTQVTADSDTIVLPDPTVVQYYLAWKFMVKINSGVDDATTQPMYQQYVARREKLKQKEVIGRTFKLKPILNNLDENADDETKYQRLGNYNLPS